MVYLGSTGKIRYFPLEAKKSAQKVFLENSAKATLPVCGRHSWLRGSVLLRSWRFHPAWQRSDPIQSGVWHSHFFPQLHCGHRHLCTFAAFASCRPLPLWDGPVRGPSGGYPFPCRMHSGYFLHRKTLAKVYHHGGAE